MTRSAILGLSAAIAAAGLAGCSAQDGRMPANRNVCLPFPAAATTTTTTTTTANGQAAAPAVAAPMAADPAASVEDCLHRWGYALAASTDDANQAAAAAVAACGPAIARWNQAALAPAEGEGGGGPIQAPSLLTGQETTPLNEHYLFAQGRALFYVVQARAGKCAAPPLTNGALTGVAY